MKVIRLALLVLSLWWSAFGQIEESRAVMLKGSGAPTANCVVGERFFRTDATAGQNLYLCTATNTWTQVTGGGSSTVVLPLLIGVCSPGLANIGLGWTYAGTNAASTSCQSARTGSGASDRLTLLYNTASMVSYAHFGVPSGIAGGSLTLKFSIDSSSTATPTFESAVGCYAVNADVTANLSFSTPVTVTWAQAWGTASRKNRGTVTISDAAIAAGNFCMVLLRRTDANGGNFFIDATWLEF